MTDKIWNFPTKNKEGFTRSELEELLKKEFPHISIEQVSEKMGINTCLLIDEEVVTFHSDVLTGIRCVIENRNQNTLEWD